MKRTNLIVAMVLALSLGATVAFAGQNGNGNGPGNGNGNGNGNAADVSNCDGPGNGNGNDTGNGNENRRGKAKSDRPGRGHRGAAFVDEDGDGFNDLAPDADGDGIPNGLDSDYVRPRDGAKSAQAQWGRIMATQHGKRFFWSPYGLHTFGGSGKAFGPGNRTPGVVGPRNGSGFGPGLGTGTCTEADPGDGTTGRKGGPPDRGSRR